MLMRIADSRRFFGEIWMLSIHLCGSSNMMSTFEHEIPIQTYSVAFSQAIVFHSDESSCAEILIFSPHHDIWRENTKA